MQHIKFLQIAYGGVLLRRRAAECRPFPHCHPGLDPGSGQLFDADKIPDQVRDDMCVPG